MLIWLLPLGAYLLGSLPIGLWLVRATHRLDIREYGSGNIGTINVFRVAGPWVGASVLVLDAAKAWLPTVLAPSPAWGVMIGLCAIAGHNWSPWLHFRGGKGVAASLGVLLALAPAAAAAGVVVWLVVVLLSRYASLGSLSGILAVVAWVFVAGAPTPVRVLAVAAAVLVFVRHRANIRRLLRGQELHLALR